MAVCGIDGIRRSPIWDGSWMDRGDDPEATIEKRRSPLVRMTCVRRLPASRKKVPAAPRRVKGEGTRESSAATTTSVGGAIGGATGWPVLVARPALSP